MPTARFDIPGAPPSVNHLYERTLIRTATGVRPSVRKSDGVENYQVIATLIARTAVVDFRSSYSGGFIRIRYWFFLRRDVDCDNALKALNDAVAAAIGVNDKKFLPCVVDKFVPLPKGEEPHVIVELEWDEPGVRGGLPVS